MTNHKAFLHDKNIHLDIGSLLNFEKTELLLQKEELDIRYAKKVQIFDLEGHYYFDRRIISSVIGDSTGSLTLEGNIEVVFEVTEGGKSVRVSFRTGGISEFLGLYISLLIFGRLQTPEIHD